MQFLRNCNESYISYLKRVIQATREKQLSYAEMGDCLLGERNVYSSENLRKCFYALDIIADKLDEDILVTDEDVLKNVAHQKDELFKATQKLRDKQREIRNDLRKMARYENLVEVLIENLSNTPPPSILNNSSYEPLEDVEASVLISDFHYGIEINNSVNKFDKKIAKVRLSNLITRVVSYCEIHKVKVLNVELLGDLISGCINVSNRVEQEEDLISQIVEVSNLLSSAINYLCSKIPVVNVYCVFGNHSRVYPNKKENLNRENYERLIFKYIEIQASSIATFITSEQEDYLRYELNNGKIIVCTHGDKDNLSNIVSNYATLLGFIPDEIHLGHYHNFKVIDDNNTFVIVNGSIIGSDNYAVSIRKNTAPCQVLRIYGRDSVTYAIKL